MSPTDGALVTALAGDEPRELLERGAVALGGVRIAYESGGGGELALLLHCSGSSAGQWRALAEALVPSFRVVCPEFYGSGRSEPWPHARPIGLADQVELVLHAAGDARAPVHLVGHSYGGAVALRLARQLGPRLASLTLVEPSAFHLLRQAGFAEAQAFCEIAGIALAIEEALARGEPEAGMAAFVDYWNGAGSFARLKPETRARLARGTGGAAQDFAALFAQTTPLAAYRAITAPTLIAHGTESPAPSLRVCDLLARTLPNVEVTVVQGAGHMLPQTHGGLVHAAIAAHLRWSTAPWRHGGRLAA